MKEKIIFFKLTITFSFLEMIYLLSRKGQGSNIKKKLYIAPLLLKRGMNIFKGKSSNTQRYDNLYNMRFIFFSLQCRELFCQFSIVKSLEKYVSEKVCF